MRESVTSSAVTFRGNMTRSRHGWLRLTPAYSVELVERLVEELPRTSRVLDPFCGSGTTLLTCAERGLSCTTIDLNPFLVWLANAKAAPYTPQACAAAGELVLRMAKAAQNPGRPRWLPPISNIGRWWEPRVQAALGHAFAVLERSRARPASKALATVSFCRTLIACANVSFGHQSMSFKAARAAGERGVEDLLLHSAHEVCASALESLRRPQARALVADARSLGRALPRRRFDAVVTSPPYCNRMSYVRELRPYMYWLGHLTLPASAGELDWQAIGGTWGVATSRLNHWQPSQPAFSNGRALSSIVRAIAAKSELLSRYVQRYFSDMAEHLASLFPLLARGARLHYVIGNSKFYDVLLPTQELLALQMREAGLHKVNIETLRTRTSKVELYEYLVSAEKP